MGNLLFSMVVEALFYLTMDIRDLLITPIWLLIIYIVAYLIRPSVTTETTRKYFIPALSAKILGAISLGIIYQFYYGGGDTFTYFSNGAKNIYEAFLESPAHGLELIFTPRQYPVYPSIWASKIWIYKSETEFFVARVAGFFDIFTFHTYSSTASFFGIISFSGVWAMYQTLIKVFPFIHKKLAIAILFIPSVVFWGSGILKDSLTLGAVCWITYGVFNLFQLNRNYFSSILAILGGFFVLYTVKIYILLCFLPCTVFWFFIRNLSKIKNVFIKTVLAPIVLTAGTIVSFYTAIKVSAESNRYSIENIQQTAEATAWWISYSGSEQGGSTYTLGDLDFSASGIAKKSIPAIWVALFRPHPWEVRNPVMALSALENLFILFLALKIFVKNGFLKTFGIIGNTPILIYFFSFSILFAFAVGLTTYNFGSLVRYKIPLLPFFVSGFYILEFEVKKKEILKRLKA